VTYTAYDFSGKSVTDSTSITIEEDTIDPSASLSVASDSVYYSVPNRGYTNDVTWMGSASDSETGIVSPADGCGYAWSGELGSRSPSCSETFTTYYTSTGTYDVTFTAEDYHGNTASSDSGSVIMIEDQTDPSVSGAYTDTATGSDSGVGIWKVTGYVTTCRASGDVDSKDCDLTLGSDSASLRVDVDVESASVPNSCGTQTDRTSARAEGEAVVTFHDYHGNTQTVTIDDSDYEEDNASQTPCEPTGPGGEVQ
jgi:hypothetical protein